MAQPSSREGLIDYAKRQLGFPVLEINVADEQFQDLLDDAIQVYQERHYDGIVRMYLKYKITQEDIDRGKADPPNDVGIVTTTATGGGFSNTWYENSNFINCPDSVIGVEKVFKFDTSSISGGMFSIKYQLFLNDLYFFN